MRLGESFALLSLFFLQFSCATAGEGVCEDPDPIPGSYEFRVELANTNCYAPGPSTVGEGKLSVGRYSNVGGERLWIILSFDLNSWQWEFTDIEMGSVGEFTAVTERQVSGELLSLSLSGEFCGKGVDGYIELTKTPLVMDDDEPGPCFIRWNVSNGKAIPADAGP